jgi:hypothetical protein
MRAPHPIAPKLRLPQEKQAKSQEDASDATLFSDPSVQVYFAKANYAKRAGKKG